MNWDHASGTGADGVEALDTYITAPAYLAMTHTGLTGSVAGGPIVIDGVTVTAASIATYNQPSQTVSYRYVSAAGTWTQIEVNPGDPVPSTPAGTVLVGVSESNTTEIVIDRVVAPWLYPFPLIDAVEMT